MKYELRTKASDPLEAREPAARWQGVSAHDAVIDGMPGKALGSFLASFADTPTKALLLAIGISERSAQRVKADPGKLLDSQVSDGIVKVAGIRALAADVLGSDAAAEAWINAEQVGLEFRKPIELIRTTPGLDLVRTLLQRMRYGVYA